MEDGRTHSPVAFYPRARKATRSYALRHSSIVRSLRNRLPIQHVAKLHNTSVKMIERHYAKYISTALEDLARAAIVPLVPRHVGTTVGCT